MNLESKIESFLFWKGEPQTFAEIAAALKVSKEEVMQAVSSLKTALNGRGIILVEHHESVMLGTCAEMSQFFEELRKEELNKELSKAALETLSIVLYKDMVSRAEINFIRGVNSGYILRNLEVRGLVERVSNKLDQRSYVYKPTLSLLSYLGVSSIGELPEFETIKKTLEDKLSSNTSDEN